MWWCGQTVWKNDSAAVSSKPLQENLKGNKWNIQVQMFNSSEYSCCHRNGLKINLGYKNKQVEIYELLKPSMSFLSSFLADAKRTNSRSAVDQTPRHTLTLSSRTTFTVNVAAVRSYLDLLEVSLTFSPRAHRICLFCHSVTCNDWLLWGQLSQNSLAKGTVMLEQGGNK